MLPSKTSNGAALTEDKLSCMRGLYMLLAKELYNSYKPL